MNDVCNITASLYAYLDIRLSTALNNNYWSVAFKFIPFLAMKLRISPIEFYNKSYGGSIRFG